jgi:hypothetical protein
MSAYETDCTAAGLDGPRSIPDSDKISLRYSAQIEFGTHPDYYPMSTDGKFLGIKRPRCETDHSPPSSAEVKNDGATTPLPHTSSCPTAYCTGTTSALEEYSITHVSLN